MFSVKLAGVDVRDVETLVLEELANRGILIDGDNNEKVAMCFPEESFINDRVYGGVAVS